MRCYRLRYLCLWLVLTTTPLLATPHSRVTIGRYLSVAATPSPAQQHLLAQQVNVKFPASVFSIQDAIQFLLQFSGYRLATAHRSPGVTAMLAQPLPAVDRHLSPMPLQDALITLAGSVFYLLVDPVHRLISFQLKQPYQSLYPTQA